MKTNLKKIAYTAFIAIFILLCLPFGVSVFFSEGNADIEKKELAAFPSVFDENAKLNGNFDSELSEYMSQRIMFREKMLTLNSKLRDLFFNSSAEEQVIIGRDGWLFFEETIDDYSALNTLSARGIFNIADTLEQLNDYCKKNGINFVFTVAPNKNTLYSKYMPSRYLRNTENNLTMLMNALGETSVNYVNLKALFQTWDGEALYYKTDTHWNNEGALLAYNALLDAVEKPHETYDGVKRKLEKTWAGDLEGMLYPGSSKYEDELSLEYEYSFSYARRFKSAEDIVIETANENAEGSLLMFRDSFANNMLSFLSQEYASAYYSRAVPCDFTLAKSRSADTVIYEIAERNLQNIINRAPLMPSSCGSIKVDYVPSSGNFDLNFTQGEYAHFYGSVDAGLNDNSNIYLVFTDENGESFYYRCFNAYEAALLGEKEYHDNGFSVYINSAEIETGNYSISMMIDSDGKHTFLNTNKIFSDNELKDN